MLIAMSLLILASIILLIPSMEFFPHISIVPRIVLPLLLVAGLAGAVLRKNYLLLIGKVGVWILILYGIAGLPEPEDLPYSGHLKYGVAFIELKYVLFLLVAAGLWACFWRLGRLQRPKKHGS
jgi:hypothetical protein